MTASNTNREREFVSLGGKEINQEFLNEVLSYQSDSGKLFWKVSPSQRVKAGDEAGSFNSNTGYLTIGIGGKNYKVHRVIWMMVYGRWPEQLIDHIDRNTVNNKLSNLREATNRQNSCNRVRPLNSARPFRGVEKYQGRRKVRYRVSIRSNGRNHRFGSFDCPIAAARIADQAAIKEFGKDFAQLNFPDDLKGE